jgi:hypothetical protein
MTETQRGGISVEKGDLKADSKRGLVVLRAFDIAFGTMSENVTFRKLKRRLSPISVLNNATTS